MADIYQKYDDKSGEFADFGDLKARKDIGIVEDTDIAEHTIAAGQYVIWKGNLYTANSAITSGDALSINVLTAVTIGGLNKLDSSISAIDSSLAIVADGDTHIAISSGEYVYVKNHGTLAEGLYTANSAIGANVSLTTSNLTSVSKGGFNKIVDIAHGGTGATVAGLARQNLGMISQTLVIDIPSNGWYDWNISNLHLTDRPLAIFLTPASFHGHCQYNWDGSTKDKASLFFCNENGAAVTGLVRLSALLIY